MTVREKGFLPCSGLCATWEQEVDQQEFERSMVLIMAAGIVIAVIEFLVMGFIVNKPDIVGFQNAFISAGGVLVVVVIVLWVATAVLRPKVPSDVEAVQSTQEPAEAATEDSGQA